MNADEADALLKTIRVIDPRIAADKVIDPLQVALWAEMLSDVPYRAAEAAMKEHYKTSTERIMPGHIRPLVKKLRTEWRETRRRQEVIQRTQEARTRPQIEATTIATLSEAEKAQRRSERQHSPAVAEALAEVRAKLKPSNPRVFDAPWQVKSQRAQANGPEETSRGQEPQRLGGLLRAVAQQVRAASNEAA